MPTAPGASIQRLKDLRTGLLRLHMRLLDSQKAAYERDIQPITSPSQYFGLAMNDPFFAWLRQLSQFIVSIDELLDTKEPAEPQAAERVIQTARELISPSETGEGFGRQYYDAMQRDPAVVRAHDDMTLIFNALGI